MAQTRDLKGEGLRVVAVDPKVSWEVVSDGTGSRNAAINELKGDGDAVGKGMQVMANQDGGIEEAIRGTRVDQRGDGDRRLARDHQVNHKGKVARGGEGKGGGKRKGTAQPGSNWLGREFFDGSGAGREAAAAAASAADGPNWVWGEGT